MKTDLVSAVAMAFAIATIAIFAAYLGMPLFNILVNIGNPGNMQKNVIFYVSDYQGGWMESVQVRLADLFVSKNMSVVIGVIPIYTEKSSFALLLRDWDRNPRIEIAQHGYDHETYLKGKAYSEQSEFIRKGRESLLSLGIDSKIFVSPFASVDGNTIKALEELDYDAIIDATDLPYKSDKLLIIDEGVPLCRNGLMGRDCSVRDGTDITREINEKISKNGIALVYFEMHDISDGYAFSEEKFSRLSELLDYMLDEGYSSYSIYEYIIGGEQGVRVA